VVGVLVGEHGVVLGDYIKKEKVVRQKSILQIQRCTTYSKQNKGVIMAGKVVLDAMIRRADFGVQSDGATIEQASSLTIEQLTGLGPIAKLLRKPDFQRETNQWSPDQVAGLINSFARGELIPALILWKSQSHVFVIDGAHRLSALRAWVEDDFGDRSVSHSFFDGNLPKDQLKLAKRTRMMVERLIGGTYADLKKIVGDDSSEKNALHLIASNVFSRSVQIQWIPGASQEVAETSFFKINTRGTTLDKVEELLLRFRKTSYAIAARSIVRAGTGHKYWSSFSDEVRSKVEAEASVLNELLFQPGVDEPIKTLDLPLGGTSSPVDALKMLIDLMAIVDGSTNPSKAIEALAEDLDGQDTLDILKRLKRNVKWVTGNDASSLGLHPAVYFYTERGKHSRFLFLGVFKCISDKIRNNNKGWFSKFTNVRSDLEKMLIDRKSLINQGLSNVNSNQRIERVEALLNHSVAMLSQGSKIADKDILQMLGLEGSAGSLSIIDVPKGFSKDVKSAVFLQDALDNAVKCKICGGYLHAEKSVSYDHKIALKDGGPGSVNNAQLTHPYCNTGIKN
jgi:hypothetical protein